MNSGQPDRQGTVAPANFFTRLRGNTVDRSLIANPPVAALFCLFRWLHLIAPEPYWVYVAIVVGGGVTSVVCSTLWEDPKRPWHLNAYVASNLAVITVVAYSTGWGPILSIGFLFGAAAAFQLFGSKATWACVIWTAVDIGLGQLAITVHLAPSFIHEPLMFGVSTLGLVGAVLVIELLGRATAEREAVESESRQSERRFKALVSNAADIIVVVDQAGNVQYVSPAFERILGQSMTAYHDESLATLIHPDDLKRLAEGIPPATGRSRDRAQDGPEEPGCRGALEAFRGDSHQPPRRP